MAHLTKVRKTVDSFDCFNLFNIFLDCVELSGEFGGVNEMDESCNAFDERAIVGFDFKKTVGTARCTDFTHITAQLEPNKIIQVTTHKVLCLCHTTWIENH